MFGLGRRQSDLPPLLSDLPSRITTLIISNEKINDIMKRTASLEESG